MKKYICIGCGGFAGAVLRSLIKGVKFGSYPGSLPLNTLFINVSGAFVLAFLLTAALKGRAMDPDLRIGLTTGFLGAFTTFSTLCKEAVGLFFQGNAVSAIVYLAVSTMLGFGAAYLGSASARRIGSLKTDKAGEIPENESEAD